MFKKSLYGVVEAAKVGVGGAGHDENDFGYRLPFQILQLYGYCRSIGCLLKLYGALVVFVQDA